jgi:hypothetical protein
MATNGLEKNRIVEIKRKGSRGNFKSGTVHKITCAGSLRLRGLAL